MKFIAQIQTFLDPKELQAKAPGDYRTALAKWAALHYPEMSARINNPARCLVAVAELYGLGMTAEETLVPSAKLNLAEPKTRIINGKPTKSRRLADKMDARRRSGRFLSGVFDRNMDLDLLREDVPATDADLARYLRDTIRYGGNSPNREGAARILRSAAANGVSVKFAYWCVSHDFDIQLVRETARRFAREAILAGPGKPASGILDKLGPEAADAGQTSYDRSVAALESGFLDTDATFPTAGGPFEIVAASAEQAVARVQETLTRIGDLLGGSGAVA